MEGPDYYQACPGASTKLNKLLLLLIKGKKLNKKKKTLQSIYYVSTLKRGKKM